MVCLETTSKFLDHKPYQNYFHPKFRWKAAASVLDSNLFLFSFSFIFNREHYVLAPRVLGGGRRCTLTSHPVFLYLHSYCSACCVMLHSLHTQPMGMRTSCSDSVLESPFFHGCLLEAWIIPSRDPKYGEANSLRGKQECFVQEFGHFMDIRWLAAATRKEWDEIIGEDVVYYS